MVGRTVGKYRIVEQIGRGGMGTVYKAVDETLDRQVAIKILNADLIDQEAVERFRREAITLAKLNHGRIGAIHELARDGHDLLMVMEFLQGETFEKLIERGPMPVPRAVALCAQVLDALQYAHNAGVIHRDLKPANVMVTPSGDVKVMDFGIARVQGSEHLTTNGYMVGTPAYMAPEQVRGEEVDPRMDLYAMAVVLYRMVTQRLPFHGDTAIAMIHSQLTNPPTPPRQFRADLPEWIVDVITKGLSKAPADRFQTASEFRAALEAGVTGRMPIPHPGEAETIGPMLTPPSMRAPVVTSGVTPAASSAQPMPHPAVGPVPGATSAQPTPPPRPSEATVTLRAPHLATAGALLALLVVGIGVLAFVALRRQQQPVTPAAVEATPPAVSAPENTTPTASVTPPVTPSAASPTEPIGNTAAAPTTAAATTAAPAPRPSAPSTATGAAATTPGSTTAAATPSRGATTPATGAPGVGARGTTTPAATPATAAAGRGTPAPPAPTPAPTPAAAAPAAAPPAAPVAPAAANAPTENFGDIKAMMVESGRGREVDALLSFEPGSLFVRAKNDGSLIRSMPYSSIIAATYARARRPRGQPNPGMASVPENLGGGVLGGSRHWLTLQAAGEFLIVRLEDRNVARVLSSIERRTGAPVIRPTPE